MTPHRSNSRNAAALVVVVGVLFVLATLAISFASFMTVERSASRIRVDEVQARFCAFAGYEHAIQEILLACRRPYDGPDQSWYYKGNAASDGNGVELDEADEPSFYSGDAYGRAYSGVVGEGRYETDGDTYTLKVLDAASKINLNNPIDSRKTTSANPLYLMLVNLGFAIDSTDPPITGADATAIIAYRATLTGDEFDDVRDLLDIPTAPISDEEFEQIRPFLTVSSWRDGTSVAPMDPAYAPTVGDDVMGRIPTGDPVSQDRAPIDINTAPKEVLTAVLTGLQGVWVDKNIDRSAGGSDAYRSTGEARRSTAITFATAQSLADDIIAWRESTSATAGPFEDWEDFGRFIDATSLSWPQKAVVIANCNPNVNTHRANPDRHLWREIDKFDLLTSTTEFCFNSGGVFEIEILGRVTANGGQIVARSEIFVVVEAFDIYRATTQSDFNSGSTSKTIIRIPTDITITAGWLSQGDVNVNGTVVIDGSLHTNGNLDFAGQPTITGDATGVTAESTNNYNNVGGVGGGGFPAESIPDLNPADFKADCDWILKADGTIEDASGNPVTAPSSVSYSSGTWSGDPADFHGHTIYVEGNLEMTGSSPATRRGTFSVIATGHIGVINNSQILAHHPQILWLAGTDIWVRGNGATGATNDTLIYAGEQIETGGTVFQSGPVIARGRSSADSYVTGNKLHGTPDIKVRSGVTVPGGTTEVEIPTIARFPDADATATVNGTVVNLAEYNNYDGHIGLAPYPLQKDVLGSEPYTDKLLAGWAKGFDADESGGSATMSGDTSGPVLAPVVSDTYVGNLLRDGFYSEQDSVGAFEALDNLGALTGSMAFWFKPSWDADSTVDNPSSKTHHILALSRTVAGVTQDFYLVQVGQHATEADRVIFHYERTLADGDDTIKRRVYTVSWYPPAHEWTHIAIVYDFTEDDGTNSPISLFVDGAEVSGAIYDYTGNRILTGAEQAASPINAANFLRIGERTGADHDGFYASAPEATYDEFVCLDTKESAAWAAGLYGIGRYYSGGDAIYTSTDLPITSGSDILHAAWTVRYPANWVSSGKPTVRIALVVGGTVVKEIDVTSEDVAGLDPSTDAALAAALSDISGIVHYRATFLDPTQTSSGPFFSTPILDDVTIAYAGETQILRWEE